MHQAGGRGMSINYDKLVVSGIEFQSVLKLQISQKVNTHATVELELEVNKEIGQLYMQGVNEQEMITIGVPEVIFIGAIQKVTLNYEESYCVLHLQLVSSSILWDIQKVNRSYQIVGDTYSQIMTKATNGQGIIEFNGKDITSTGMIVQYQETIWEFILRLAAECGEPVYVNPTSEKPHVIIGVQQSSNTYSSNVTSNKGAEGCCSGYVALGGTTEQGLNIGCSNSVMQNGELITSYESMIADTMVVPKTRPKFAGRVMAGFVKAVNRDLVQVHITDLDSEYDGGTTVWLPYSTLYSSEANSAGIYCMPAVGDPVRVFFPTDNPGDAFVSSSCAVRGIREDAAEKCFTTPEGMTVLFGKEGIYINNNKKWTYILLAKSGDIQIASEQNINIHAKQNINMQATEGQIYLKSDKKICLATGQSMLAIGTDDTIMVSKRILTQ